MANSPASVVGVDATDPRISGVHTPIARHFIPLAILTARGHLRCLSRHGGGTGPLFPAIVEAGSRRCYCPSRAAPCDSLAALWERLGDPSDDAASELAGALGVSGAVVSAADIGSS